MKLSKPEDMDEFGEQTENQSSDVDPTTAAEMAAGDGEIEGRGSRTVEAFGDEIEIGEAVEVIAGMVEEPGHFGMATDADVIELREKVAQQEKAIAELAEAVEILAENQAGIVDASEGATVALDPEPLTGIYDPTQEFGNGK